MKLYLLSIAVQLPPAFLSSVINRMGAVISKKDAFLHSFPLQHISNWGGLAQRWIIMPRSIPLKFGLFWRTSVSNWSIFSLSVTSKDILQIFTSETDVLVYYNKTVGPFYVFGKRIADIHSIRSFFYKAIWVVRYSKFAITIRFSDCLQNFLIRSQKV